MARSLTALVLLVIATSTAGQAAQAPQAAAATAAPAAAPPPDVIDLNGSWIGTIMIPDKGKRTPSSLHAVLTHAGATLTGTAGSSTKSQKAFTDGRVQTTRFGTTVTFDLPGPNSVMTFELRAVDGVLSGLARVPGATVTLPVQLHRVESNARARATNVSGAWIGTFGLMDAEHLLQVVFEQSGATLTGTAGPHTYKQMPITQGKVETAEAGTKLSFQVDMAADEVVMLFELTLTDTGLKGTVTVSQNGEQASGRVELKPVK